MSAVHIREETPADHAAIHAITARAFAPMPFADGDEADLIGVLRQVGALVLSLVAEQDGACVGQVTFSPAYPSDGGHGWFALGPVAVQPELQGRGIGAMLIREGLARLRSAQARGCILVGNPAYYERFGFRPAPDQCPADQPAEVFQLLAFAADPPAGPIGFHPAFGGH